MMDILIKPSTHQYITAVIKYNQQLFCNKPIMKKNLQYWSIVMVEFLNLMISLSMDGHSILYGYLHLLSVDS